MGGQFSLHTHSAASENSMFPDSISIDSELFQQEKTLKSNYYLSSLVLNHVP